MNRWLLLVASCGALACVQSGSVGSDTGRSDEGVDPSASDDESAASDGTGQDPYEVCRDIETSGQPFPDSCTLSPSDSQCLQCIKLVCCSELMTCSAYQACACQIDCAASEGPSDVCADACASDGASCDLSGCGEIECEQLCAG